MGKEDENIAVETSFVRGDGATSAFAAVMTYLIIGFASSLLTAWGCAWLWNAHPPAWADGKFAFMGHDNVVSNNGVFDELGNGATAEWARSVFTLNPLSPSADEMSVEQSVSTSFGVRTELLIWHGYDYRAWSGRSGERKNRRWVCEAGWPMRAFYAEARVNEGLHGEVRNESTGDFRRPWPAKAADSSWPKAGSPLPYRLILAGAATDTLAHGLLWWAAIGSIRRLAIGSLRISAVCRQPRLPPSCTTIPSADSSLKSSSE